MRDTSRIEKKIRKKRIGLIIIILFLIFSIFFILFTQTNFFNVSNVEVNNNENLKEEEIIMASGLLMDNNIFSVDISEMKENLIKHPYIKNVQVERNYPNGIIINIEERKEYTVLYCVGSYILLDSEGVILDITQQKNEKMQDLSQINAMDVNQAYIGEKIILSESEDIDKLLEFLNLSKVIGLYGEISIVEINEDFSINFLLKSGTKVAFGVLDNVKYKLSYIIEIYDEITHEMDLTNEQISKCLIDLTRGEDAIFTIEAN